MSCPFLVGDRVEFINTERVGQHGTVTNIHLRDRLVSVRVDALGEEEPYTGSWYWIRFKRVTDLASAVPSRPLDVGDRVRSLFSEGPNYGNTGVITSLIGNGCYIKWDKPADNRLETRVNLEYVVREGEDTPIAGGYESDLKAAMRDLQLDELPKWLIDLAETGDAKACKARMTWHRVRELAQQLDEGLQEYGPSWHAAAEVWRRT